MPATVAPATVDEVAGVLRDPSAGAVLARGGGTKAGWGAPAGGELVVDLSRLDRIVDHAAGDMVVQVQAGVPLARLAAALAGAGQQLAIDVPSYEDGTALDAGTVGGALAVGLAGPRRLRYGGPRDLLLGVTIVRADGTIASSGGRVVKNVAGYDIGKLLCGSYGTLGLIVAATLRLHPLPAATGWVSVAAPDAAAAYAAAQVLLDSQLAPSAVELDRPAAPGPVEVAALFEGTEQGVAARGDTAAALVGGVVGSGPPEWFGRWPSRSGGTRVEVSLPPAGVPEAVSAVDAAAARAGLAVRVRGSTGVASLSVGLPSGAPPAAVARFLPVLRAGLAAAGGAAVVRDAPAAVRAEVDAWGPVDPGALALMHRVKDQFDPGHRLAPGRFVAGI